MADVAKYTSVNGGTTVATEFKNLFSIVKTRTTVGFFIFTFVGFTVFLAFCPSSNSSSPWVSNIFSATSAPSATADTHRSHFPLLFNFSFHNTSSLQQQSINFTSISNNHTRSFNDNDRLPSSRSTSVLPTDTCTNKTQSSVLHANRTEASSPSVIGNLPITINQTEKEDNSDKAQFSQVNQTTTVTEATPVVANRSRNSPEKSGSFNKVNQTSTLTEKAPAVANVSDVSPAKSDSSDKGVASTYVASKTKRGLRV
ncbi:hypothetical protein F3Y22_tig00110450pilonHSYRG01111 [Hibiscus syriacus]|uniref:Uncharacterized protein n=1 Tax=Hibiscus syriacus TaxID=106335 RepID=A0A6A3AP18_HIBSY|nr:hypothetical protein F3Y22_tig00110450pilonHSYRG01111 [Hibiscus syriacus]